jgi:signal transduction histidine kinase
MTPASAERNPVVTALTADPFLWAYGAVFVVETVLLATPVLGPASRERFGAYQFLFPALALMVAGGWAGLGQVSAGEERRFWRFVATGFGCWLIAHTITAAYTGAENRHVIDVVIDTLSLVAYLLPLMALERKPHLGSARGAVELDRRLKSIGISCVAGGWYAYFVLVPEAMDPGFHRSVLPSFYGFLTLDLLLVGRSLTNAIRCNDRRWRVIYLALAAGAFANGVADVCDTLVMADVLSWTDGSPTDLVWLVSPGIYLLASRLRHAPLPVGPVDAQRPPNASYDLNPLKTASLLLAGAFTFPMGHIWLYSAEFGNDVLERGHGILVLCALAVLGTLALVGYLTLDQRYRAIEAARRSMESRLRETQRLETMGRLAGGVAHDFNNLLMAILGYNDLAIDTLASDDPSRPLLEEVRIAGRRGQALTRQLLAFSRRQELKLQRVDLGLVVTNVERMLARLIGENISVEVGLAPDLGRVMADPGHLESAVLTLAVNARDAMPHGGRLKMTVENVEVPEDAESGGAEPFTARYVQLVVRDNGVGIPGEAIQRVFEPFFFTSTAPRDKGTGLGLAAVHGIVTQIGGTISAASVPGEGTAFTIRLPHAEAGPE